jgi:3-oxoacid CoA-transferase
MILSYVGTNKALQDAYLSGNVALELNPQGTIAERLRSAGAGMPGFYTRTGAGTGVETGGIPQLWSKKDGEGKQTVLVPGNKKEAREFDGKRYIFEPAIHGDVAILRAWKVDKAGNCVFRYTTQAFATLAAKAAKVTIVEAENIVEIGEISPMEVHLAGVYVNRIVPATSEKKIELVTLTEETSGNAAEDVSGSKSEAQIKREKIAMRAAHELKDGFYVNLGVGIPVLAANYLEPGVNVWLQSENGILGMGRYPTKAELDADIINAAKETVTLVPGASTFDSSESFTMIRGGHMNVSILGAMEVSASGDLANYSKYPLSSE